MTMPVIVQGTLQSDGTLKLDQPPNLPPGPVVVTVQPAPAATATKGGLADVIDEIQKGQQARGFQGRSAEEIEAVRQEQTPSVSDEFYAEAARLPDTIEAFEAQRVIFRQWRNDPRFEAYWRVLDDALTRTFEQVQKWAAARAALADLEGYDFDAYRKQREYDQQHAGDHVLSF